MIARILPLLLAGAACALEPGLIGRYFQGTELPKPGTKPFYARIDGQVNFRETNGDFNGSKMADRLSVVWTGTLRIAAAGRYGFATSSDDGSRLHIDGELVVDNWGMHSWGRKAGEADLAAGDHAIRVEFNEGGGGAGCVLRWTPPGGAEAVVPKSALFHDPAAFEAIDWDQAAWKKAKATRGKGGGGAAGGPYDFRYGPFVGTALRVGETEQGGNVAFRAIIVPLDEAGDVCVAFDGDTMRMAGGWTAGGLVLKGLPFTGGHGQFPSVNGDTLFVNRAAPGWAGPDGSFEEPRTTDYPPLGPLPKDWAHYKGLYRHGDRVVFKYTVGTATVLETPMLAGSNSIARVIKVRGADKPLRLAAAEGDAVEIAVTGGELTTEDDRQVVTIPAGDSLVTVVYNPDGTKLQTVDPETLTGGGPARFTNEIVTVGELSTDDKAPYVIDRITVPYKNPYGIPLRIGGMDFFRDGTRAAVSTWDGDVWIVSGIDEDLDELRWKRFASGAHEALGLKIVDDVVHTVADDQITRYHDLNGDGEADFYENVNNDWELTSGFHAFCFDLHTDPEGNFVFAFGSPVRGGGRSFERMGAHHGSILKVSPDGARMEVYASGLRAPNGICVGPDGQVTTGDNEGTFVPRCPINWVQPGDFLGVVDSYQGRDRLKTTATVPGRTGDRPKHLEPSEAPKPMVWLPKGVDNSGGGQVWVTSDRWGPFEGELLHMSYGRSALHLVLRDRRDSGQMQGGVVKFPLRFTSSAMRARFNPRDGQLYVAGLKGWQSNAAKEGGFDRVRYTGEPVRMPSGLRVEGKKVRLTFTSKLDEELATDPESYAVKASDIQWTHNYGSGEFLIGGRAAGRYEKGWTKLTVAGAKLLPGGREVEIEIPDLVPAHLVEIKLDLETEDGDEIFSTVNATVHEQ